MSEVPTHNLLPAADEAALRRRIAELEEQLAVHREAAEQHRLYEERDRFFKLSLDMLCIVDFDGRFRRVSPAWMQTLGYTEVEIVGQPFMDFVHPDDQAATAAASADVNAGQDVFRFENRYRRKDGLYIWVEWQSSVVPEHRLIYAVARDITVRKQLEETLLANERRLTRFLDALPVGVFVIDSQARPFYANHVAAAILGKGIVPGIEKEQLAQQYRAYIADSNDEYPVERMPLVRALSGDLTMIDDMEIHQPGRTIALEVRGAPIRNDADEVEFAMAIFTDITERRNTEALIRAQSSALQELSTPLIPISDTVVVLPLIGAIDSNRAQLIMDTLLEGIARRHVETAIIDITGVSVVDTQVATALIRAAQAVKLLGAEVMITGIRPEVAQTLVGLGVDMTGISTRGTLQAGIASVLGGHRAASSRAASSRAGG